MNISHKCKFIFLANPQCGSTSIGLLLKPYSDILGGKGRPYFRHEVAKVLKQHFAEMGWNWDDYLKFTIIRNPWEKMVSRYNFGLKYPKSKWHIPAKDSSTFKEFMNHPVTIKDSIRYSIDNFAYSENKECLVDYIVRLEDIDQELPKILNKINIKVHRIPQKNKNPHDRYSQYYDCETRNQVEKMFPLDIKLGSYKFESN